jgi:hypothetical protein
LAPSEEQKGSAKKSSEILQISCALSVTPLGYPTSYKLDTDGSKMETKQVTPMGFGAEDLSLITDALNEALETIGGGLTAHGQKWCMDCGSGVGPDVRPCADHADDHGTVAKLRDLLGRIDAGPASRTAIPDSCCDAALDPLDLIPAWVDAGPVSVWDDGTLAYDAQGDTKLLWESSFTVAVGCRSCGAVYGLPDVMDGLGVTYARV